MAHGVFSPGSACLVTQIKRDRQRKCIRSTETPVLCLPLVDQSSSSYATMSRIIAVCNAIFFLMVSCFVPETFAINLRSCPKFAPNFEICPKFRHFWAASFVLKVHKFLSQFHKFGSAWILRICTKTRDGERPSQEWRRAYGRPSITWVHQICRDTGVSATEALLLAEDRPFWREA